VDTWLSILIPCYNVESYLDECVESVMEQWQAGVEIILLDDSSTDFTADVIRKLQFRYGDKLVCLKHPHNRGLSAARNTMLDQASGAYVWFLDSDDALAPGAIAQLAEVVHQHNPDLVMCDYHVWTPETPRYFWRRRGLHVKTFGGEPERVLSCPDQLFSGIFAHGKLHAWSKIFKRRLWESGVRFPEGKYFEDIWVAPRLALDVKSYYYCSSVWVKYRQREGSILATPTAKKIGDLSESLSGVLDLWLTRYPELSHRARFSFTSFCAKCLRACIKDSLRLGVHRSKLTQFRQQFYRNCHLDKWGVIKSYLNQGQLLRLRRMLRYM